MRKNKDLIPDQEYEIKHVQWLPDYYLCQQKDIVMPKNIQLKR